MAEPVSETIDSAVETVNVTNIKTVGESAAFYAGLAMKDAINHARRTEVIAENLLLAGAKQLHEMDPAQAVSVLKTMSGNDMAQQLAALIAAVASSQQGVKAAQTTPPVTA